jgi:hypothetical protein
LNGEIKNNETFIKLSRKKIKIIKIKIKSKTSKHHKKILWGRQGQALAQGPLFVKKVNRAHHLKKKNNASFRNL